MTSSNNIGHFDPVLVRPGRFCLILGVDRFSIKTESFRPLVVYVLGAFENDGVWYKYTVCLKYNWQGSTGVEKGKIHNGRGG